MKTDALSIPDPCPVAWSEMEGDERRRFCAQCDKHVTQISTMTKREARSFLTTSDEVCVQMDVFDGEVLFEPEPVHGGAVFGQRWWRRGAFVAAGLALGAPAMASSQAGPSSLVEWVASWFVEPAETVVVDPVEPLDQTELPIVLPRYQVLGGAPMLPPDWEAERRRNLAKKTKSTNKEESTALIPEVKTSR